MVNTPSIYFHIGTGSTRHKLKIFQNLYIVNIKRFQTVIHNMSLLTTAIQELNQFLNDNVNHSCSTPVHTSYSMSQGCQAIVRSLPGNQYCLDCGQPHPDWANVSHGTLHCLQCSGVHRSFGVRTSYMKSLSMDNWTANPEHILAMLEGGNFQLKEFFERHRLFDNSRYHTKAAKFYRDHLKLHLKNVLNDGEYKGRDYYRRRRSIQTKRRQ